MKFWDITLTFLDQFNLLIWNAYNNKEFRDCRYSHFVLFHIFLSSLNKENLKKPQYLIC